MATETSPEPPPIGEILHDIGQDVRTIAIDEIELSRRKLGDFMESLLVKASIALLGATVVLVGFGMLCMVAVAALQPVIHPLWLRLLVMALAYIVAGGTSVYVFGKKMSAMHGPKLDKQISEVGETFDAIKHGLER